MFLHNVNRIIIRPNHLKIQETKLQTTINIFFIQFILQGKLKKNQKSNSIIYNF